MKEIGVITKIRNNKATVRVDKKDECSKCGMCLFPKGASFIEIEAENDLSLGLGDTVIIETQNQAKLLGAVLAFLVPLLLIGLSILLNYLVIFNEIITLGVALGSIAVWYVILALIDKKLKNTVGFSAKILELVIKAENDLKNDEEKIID